MQLYSHCKEYYEPNNPNTNKVSRINCVVSLFDCATSCTVYSIQCSRYSARGLPRALLHTPHLSRAQLYLTLLQLYLQPPLPSELGLEVADNVRPPSDEAAALALLSAHGDKIDVHEVSAAAAAAAPQRMFCFSKMFF